MKNSCFAQRVLATVLRGHASEERDRRQVRALPGIGSTHHVLRVELSSGIVSA